MNSGAIPGTSGKKRVKMKAQVKVLSVLVMLILPSVAQAELPAFTQYIDGIHLFLVWQQRALVNTPIQVYYSMQAKWRAKEAPICDGTVTITRTGGPDNTTVTLATLDLREPHYTPEQAITLTLPAQPGRYEYVATIRITDPDDPKNVWTVSSRPEVQWVVTVLERTTVTLGVDGGTVSSPTFPDAPRITFPKGALTGDAQITMEVLSEVQGINPAYARLGRTVYVHVTGAELKENARVTADLAAPPPPKYPHFVCGWVDGTGGITNSHLATARCRYRDGHYATQFRRFTATDQPISEQEKTDFSFHVSFTLTDERSKEEKQQDEAKNEVKENAPVP